MDFLLKKKISHHLILILSFLINNLLLLNKINGEIIQNSQHNLEKKTSIEKEVENLRWKIYKNKKTNKSTNWRILTKKEKELFLRNFDKKTQEKDKFITSISSLNRSIIFNDEIIGPDISLYVPPGFKWNNNFKFDSSVRGYNKRGIGESFLDRNNFDAVGQFYYQLMHYPKYSFGLNLGMRSVYQGQGSGGEPIGDGISAGFRWDYKLSKVSGIAIGAEQLLHFDGRTDTGRDIYITASKGWWSQNTNGQFPLTIGTFGFGTGKLAEGNIKGLCSDLLGGSGTEFKHQRRLCWAPIFTISRVFNPKFSTFFEYNSKWFLIGSSIAPLENIPLRGTFALQISDHIDNYKINDFDELKWNFRLSYAF